jgi:hypothetical protein
MTDIYQNNNPSFNKNFCSHLEMILSKIFKDSKDNEIRHYWCDGVSWDPMPSSQLSKKSVNDTRKIITNAWIGVEGQDEYKMTVHFGKYALRRYARSQSLIDCIPQSSTMEWIKINTKEKTIEIYLN